MGNIISIPGWDISYQEKIIPFIDETSHHGMGSMGCPKGALRCLKVNIEWNMVDRRIQIFHIQRISLSSGRRTRRSPSPSRSPMWSLTWKRLTSMSSSTLANGKDTETFVSVYRWKAIYVEYEKFVCADRPCSIQYSPLGTLRHL